MIFELATDLAKGGWDAISNITAGIGKGASTLVSGFFPTPQRQTTVSEIVQAAGASGQTYRKTSTDAPSTFETAVMASEQWLNSPYEGQFAIQADIQKPKGDWIGQGLDWALEQTGKITTLYDEISPMFSSRETIVGTPREGYPEGRNEQNLNSLAGMAAEIFNLGKASASTFVDQVKGLFGLGYGQTTAQPAFTIKHDVEPTRQTWIGLAIAGAIILVVILFGRKK